MKKVNGRTLSFTFAGCFLGAGYVSGQELWQFFGCFGLKGILGLFIAIALLCVFGVIVLKLASVTGLSNMDDIIVGFDVPIVKTIILAVSMFFLFGVVVIMVAGVRFSSSNSVSLII